MKIQHYTLTINSNAGIHISDITSELRQFITDSAINNGIMSISSLHTTLAITINEAEERLLVDIDNTFSKLIPAKQGYLHDDLHLRDVPDNEPVNAHSHLIAMMLGNSESIAIVDGSPVLGTYQSVMAVELDGPRQRKISVQLLGQ